MASDKSVEFDDDVAKVYAKSEHAIAIQDGSPEMHTIVKREVEIHSEPTTARDNASEIHDGITGVHGNSAESHTPYNSAIECVESSTPYNSTMELRKERSGYWETLPINESRDHDISTYVPRQLHPALEFIENMELTEKELQFFLRSGTNVISQYPDLEEFQWNTGELVLGVRGKFGLMGMLGARPYTVRIDGVDHTLLMFNNFLISSSMRGLGIAQCMMDKLFMMGHERYGTTVCIYARAGENDSPGKITTLIARHVIIDSLACTLAGLVVKPQSVMDIDKINTNGIVEITPHDAIERVRRLHKHKLLHIPEIRDLASSHVVCLGEGNDDFIIASVTNHKCKNIYKVGIIHYVYGNSVKLTAAFAKQTGVIKIEFLMNILDKWASGRTMVSVHVVNMPYKKYHRSDVQLMLY